MSAQSRSSRVFPVVAIGALLACWPAHADDFKLGENPLSVILKWRPITADPEVKDFVKATHPADEDLKYKTLKAPVVERPKLKTKDEMNAMVRGLDAQGAALRGRGAVFDKTDPAGITRGLEAAAAESRRRAVDDFVVKTPR